jgi:hypothetical protein
MTSSPSVEAQTNDEKLSRRYRLTRRLSKPKKRVRTPQRATGVICALETACTHIRVRAAEPLVTDRPPELLTLLPGRVPRAWMDPRGQQRKMTKFLLSDFSRLTLRLDLGFDLIYASFVKRPRESSAT